MKTLILGILLATSPTDKKFIQETVQGGIAEVELGELALENAQSDEIKSLAQHIVDEHSKANDELKTIAESKQVTPPTTTNAKQKALAARLRKLSGKEFDKAYALAMIEDHKADIMKFEKVAKKGVDTDLKAFAEKTLPTLRHHLEMAEASAKAAGVKRSGQKGE